MVGFIDTSNYYFSSYSEAEIKSPNFAKYSWPKQVSREATDIFAQTHGDVFNVWMRFKVDKVDAEQLTFRLRKLNDEEIRELSVPKPWRVDWWFDGFVQQGISQGTIIDADVFVDVGNCETTHTAKDAYIALDKNSDTGYYWCDGTRGQTTTELKN